MAERFSEFRHRSILARHYGDGRSRGDFLADKFVAVFGSWSYIIWQTAVIVAWMVGNTLILSGWVHLRRVPDPYPFILLNLGFSAQASYAAPLILMAQNRGAQRDKDFAAHQFEIIDSTHQILEENTELTRQVKANTDMLDEIHRHITALTPGAGKFPPVSR
jgi:uncharacterized membrane protein